MTTAEATRSQFLEARRAGVGGSDVAAILGVSPWATAADVYFDKIGEAEPKPETFAMSRGKRIESAILDEFAETHDVEVHRHLNTMKHEGFPFMLANIDGYFIDDKGKRVGVEAKSSGTWVNRDAWGSTGTDEIPDYYLTQVHHYLAVTAWDRWHLTVWFGLDEKRDYVIERDEDIILGLIETERSFWEDHVLARVPPDAQNLDDLRRTFSKSKPGKVIEMTQPMQYHISAIAGLDDEAKWIKAEREEHQFQLQSKMGDAEAIMDGIKPVTSWKDVTTHRIDTKRFKADAPVIAAEYTTETTSRRFLVTAAGKKLNKPTGTPMTEAEVAKSLANEWAGDDT